MYPGEGGWFPLQDGEALGAEAYPDRTAAEAKIRELGKLKMVRDAVDEAFVEARDPELAFRLQRLRKGFEP